MAASGAPERQPRRGPAPIASFDHDVSDESSPETKQTFRLPEIREDSSSACGDALAPPPQRARSHSTPCAAPAPAAPGPAPPGALAAPPAPRIDISRASSSSHQDSRDSSPELALFAGSAPAGGELGFREDGALDLRSSTEELAFLEPAPGERGPPAPPSRRHSRKDSQGSEAALLAVSGRTSRLSSVGSQCSAHSAHSALSAFSHAGRVSRLSVASAASGVSGVSRSPSPHRMLLETSFCGPKPIETDPEICAAAVEERLLEMAKLGSDVTPTSVAPRRPSAGWPVAAAADPPAAAAAAAAARPASAGRPVGVPIVSAPVDARDRREVRTEATVERATPRTAPTRAVAPLPSPAVPPQASKVVPAPDDDKRQKETRNRVKAEQRRARSRERRDSGESRTKNRSKDIIRIRLKPENEYDDDDDEEEADCAATGVTALKPATLELTGEVRPARPTDFTAANNGGPAVTQRKPSRDSRTPSPSGVVVSRKSSFCSLFKSRETIASPESPSEALRRKKSLNEGRSRSRSRDRSATPTSATKIKGSVLSLFKTPRKSATSPSPSSREGSPVVQSQKQISQQPSRPPTRAEKLKYYDDAKDGIIHIPLRTPPDEAGRAAEVDTRPASAPQQRVPPASIAVTTSAPPSAGPSCSGPASIPLSSAQIAGSRSPSKPMQRTVLPDGSIIIPLRSPTESSVEDGTFGFAAVSNRVQEQQTAEAASRPASVVDAASLTSPDPVSVASGPASANPPEAAGVRTVDVTPSPDPAPPPSTIESSKRRERLLFMTQVGSGDQVFSTQFSITKTPSVTSEISGSFPSFPETEALPKDRIVSPGSIDEPPVPPAREPVASSNATSPQDPHDAPETTKDSSESEASSEAGTARGGSGNDVERRGLVVQESFEDELPYVPTTLPQERSLALPMVPVRDRGDVRVARVERPRPPHPHPHRAQVPPAPSTSGAPLMSATEGDKLRIRLPRRPRTASASAAPRPPSARTRSGSDGTETRPKADWIDFEEVPERRKQPKRIQTLPAAAGAAPPPAAAPPRDVVFSYVEPEECRCECHARPDDETPLLDPDPRLSASPVECAGGGEGARVQLSVQLARPFTGDLELSRDPTSPQESAAGPGRQ